MARLHRGTGVYYQRGAVLVVVLLFLVLIMLAGVMAVRQSNVDLKTATSDQINTILLLSSDSANQKLEMMVNRDVNSEEYQQVMSFAGVFGHFILEENHKKHEVIYCFNPRNKKYLVANTSIKEASGGFWSGLNHGFCDYQQDAGYTSARQTLITQVNISTSQRQQQQAFNHMVTGKDTHQLTSTIYPFDIRITSILPAYHEPKLGSKKCLEQTSILVKSQSPLLNCLQEAGTPSKMLYQQAELSNQSQATVCMDFGAENRSLNPECLKKS